MDLENLVQWTKSKLSRLTAGDVPITRSTRSDSLDTLTNGRVDQPLFDLYENEGEFRLVVDVPGATPRNTHLAWNDYDTLSVHVQRGAPTPDAPALSEYEESDWYREIIFSPDADGMNAHSSVRDGVLTVRIPKRRTTSSKLIPVYAT